jgi:acetyl-CoA acyltransferase 1
MESVKRLKTLASHVVPNQTFNAG